MSNVYLPVGGSGAAIFTVLPSGSILGNTEPGTELTLTPAGAARGASGITVRANSQGVYQISGVSSGQYELSVTPPPGFTAVQSTVSITMDAGAASRAAAPLQGGTSRQNIEMLTNGVIQGKAYFDLDGNNFAALREPAVGGATVRLLRGGVMVQETTAVADGRYSFAGLTDGAYTIQIVSTRFDQSRETSATLSVAVPGANLDVGMRQRAAISGRVYRNDAGEELSPLPMSVVGMSNFTVTLRSAGVERAVRSDVNGFYRFDTLPAGDYVVEVQSVDGFTVLGAISRTIPIAGDGARNGVNFGFAIGSGTVPPPTTVHKIHMPMVFLRKGADVTPLAIRIVTGDAVGARTPVTIEVTVKNIGLLPARGFRVDLYVDPVRAPGAGELWHQLCDASSSGVDCMGGAWYVTQPLAPGESITLTSSVLVMDSQHSRWTGYLPTERAQRIYVRADSLPGIAAMGEVGEVDEGNNVLDARR
jgi:hypothetical protein